MASWYSGGRYENRNRGRMEPSGSWYSGYATYGIEEHRGGGARGSHDHAGNGSYSEIYRREREPEYHTDRREDARRYSGRRGPLQIVDVDWRHGENARAHHTDNFAMVEDGRLVVRRGQSFRLSLQFNRHWDLEDEVTFTFKTGSNPNPSDGSFIKLSTTEPSSRWRLMLPAAGGSNAMFTIEPDAQCIVGEWTLTISTGGSTSGYNRPTIEEKNMYILFNPWCREDDVYFPSTKMLDEFILNDSGCIFSGTYKQIGAKPWYFGQFEPGILEASVYCLNKAFKFKADKTLGDVVQVSRALSRIVNSQDENGILVGNWSGNYGSGKSPLSWIGSVKVLQEYMRHKAPVKYGQCFVYSGILTTICRALGIPCRCVTNFASAHDTNGNTIIEVVEGETRGKSDSIWNFHVWNDVWMKRRDLPDGNDGWQALDATPQETSEGLYQCGPCPLSAVLNGNTRARYDIPFVFAEVNADVVFLEKDRMGRFVVTNTQRDTVGKNLSTKVPDGRPIGLNLTDVEDYRQDVTSEYKYPDESLRERIAVRNVANASGKLRPDLSNIRADIKISFLNQDHILVGSDFTTYIVLTNTTDYGATVKADVIFATITYNGKIIKKFYENTFQARIGPRREERLRLHIYPGDYMPHIIEAAMIRQYVRAEVQETGRIYSANDDFRLRSPDLAIHVLNHQPQVGQEFEFNVSLTNPFQTMPLTECFLTVELPGSGDERVYRIRDIPPGREMRVKLEATPKKRGVKQLYASLDCKQLNGIKGVEEIYVS